MLKINKSMTVNGTSTVNENNEDIAVAYMSACISTDGSTNANVNKSIVNQDLYVKYRTDVRKDMADFEDNVYKVEDEIIGGTDNE